MTKEEIFNEKSVLPIPTSHVPCLLKGDAMEAMDQYAKEQSIGFAEWADKEGYRQTIGKNPVWIGENMQGYSSDQLYTLYQEQKNKSI